MTIEHRIRRLRSPALLAPHLSNGILLGACGSSVPARVGIVDGQQVEIATAGAGFLTTCEAAGLDLCGIPESTLVMQSAAAIAEYRAFPMGSKQISAA